MNNEDWFLKVFGRIMVVILFFILFLAWSVYPNEKHLNGEDIIYIEAPYRAIDGSNVPIKIFTNDKNYTFKKFTLTIDENPSPCCAVFEFYDIRAEVETNIRVNAYTFLTVVGEDDYNTYIMKRYIKSAGGCSAPPLKDTNKPFGDILITKHKDIGYTTVKIFHPNYSGMQYDTLRGTEIPALFIENMFMYINGKNVFNYNGTIGIAQDVYFKLPVDTTHKEVYIEAYDNLGNRFTNK